MKKRKIKLPVRLLSILAIISLVLCITISYIWRVFLTSDYFRIKEVIAPPSKGIDLSYLKGKNIFSVDLEKESDYILAYFPNCRSVRIVRLLPDKLLVDFLERTPIAFVKLYKYFTIDKDGVIFYTQSQPQDMNLPVIVGLETKIFGAKAGKRYNIRELVLALNIIKEAQKNKFLKNCQIRKIDVTNAANTSIFIPIYVRAAANKDGAAQQASEDIEIKLGAENIRDKIVFLGGLLNQSRSDLGNIKYIDLRFKEPVIKFKDVKTK